MKKFFAPFAVVALVSVAACGPREREPAIIEEPVVEQPAPAPMTPAPTTTEPMPLAPDTTRSDTMMPATPETPARADTV